MVGSRLVIDKHFLGGWVILYGKSGDDKISVLQKKFNVAIVLILAKFFYSNPKF